MRFNVNVHWDGTGPQPSLTLASFPGLPRFHSSVCVQYNTRKGKSAIVPALFRFRVLYWTQTEERKWGRPRNEASLTSQCPPLSQITWGTIWFEFCSFTVVASRWLLWCIWYHTYLSWPGWVDFPCYHVPSWDGIRIKELQFGPSKQSRNDKRGHGKMLGIAQGQSHVECSA